MAPALAHFQAQRLPFFWADYPPGGAPGLVDRLRGLPGFHGVYPLPAMGRSLVHLPDERTREEITIAEVRSSRQQAEWLEILMEGFQEPEPTRPDFQEFLRRSVIDPLYRFNHYLAYWQGVPCATASVLRAPQAAGLYHVTTRPAYRGRGLGTAVTRAAMDAARQMGYERMLLSATSDGYPLYQRLGYEPGPSVDLYIIMGS
jgi:GNAT superfamily N-acetyltransferase